MRKLIGALFCMTLGAVVCVFAFAAHVVRTPSGHLIIWKSRPGLKDVYADIRHWTPRDWNDHRELAKSLQEAGHSDLVPQPHAGFGERFRGFLNRLRKPAKSKTESAPPR